MNFGHPVHSATWMFGLAMMDRCRRQRVSTKVGVQTSRPPFIDPPPAWPGFNASRPLLLCADVPPYNPLQRRLCRRAA